MNNEFPQPGEEIIRLTSEIEALRSDMQVSLKKLVQMEKRLRSVFPNLPKTPKALPEHARQPSNKSDEQLKEDFQAYPQSSRGNRTAGFRFGHCIIAARRYHRPRCGAWRRATETNQPGQSNRRHPHARSGAQDVGPYEARPAISKNYRILSDACLRGGKQNVAAKPTTTALAVIGELNMA